MATWPQYFINNNYTDTQVHTHTKPVYVLLEEVNNVVGTIHSDINFFCGNKKLAINAKNV